MYMRFGVGMGLFYDLLKTEAEKLYALFHNRHIFLVSSSFSGRNNPIDFVQGFSKRHFGH